MVIPCVALPLLVPAHYAAATCCGATLANIYNDESEDEIEHSALSDQVSNEGDDSPRRKTGNMKNGTYVERINSYNNNSSIQKVNEKSKTTFGTKSIDSRKQAYTSSKISYGNFFSQGSTDENGFPSLVQTGTSKSNEENLELGSSTKLTGFVDGVFTNGKVRHIRCKNACHVLKFSTDSNPILAVAFRDENIVTLYETICFNVVHSISTQSPACCMDWISVCPSLTSISRFDNSNSSFLALGLLDGSIMVYNIDAKLIEYKGAENVAHIEGDSEIKSICFLCDSNLLAFGTESGNVNNVYLDEHVSSKSVFTIENIGAAVLAMQFSPENSYLAVGGACGSVIIYHVFGDKIEQKLKSFDLNGSVHVLDFSRDSRQLACGGYDRCVVIIDTKLLQIVRKLAQDGTVDCIEYDFDQRYLAVGSRDKYLTIYDTSTFHSIKVLQSSGWVTSLSWMKRKKSNNNKDVLAIRDGKQVISILNLQPTKLVRKLKTGKSSFSSIDWSYDGRFLARSNETALCIADSWLEFEDVITYQLNDDVRCVKFCHAEGKRDTLAFTTWDGHFYVCRLCNSTGVVHLDIIHEQYLDPCISAVAWSNDGSSLALGGRGEVLYVISSDFSTKFPAVRVNGAIWAIDFASAPSIASYGEKLSSVGMAVAVAYNVILFDVMTNEPSVQIMRSRVVRCVRYHPSLPILGVGDGGNTISIFDLIDEQLIGEFSVEGRVHAIDFSHCGQFLVIASDDCKFTLHDIMTFQVIQEIRSEGWGMAASFSGRNGRYLGLSGRTDVFVLELGFFFAIEFIPLSSSGGVANIPERFRDEAMYRSGDGPSFVQRYMRHGSQQSLRQAATILKEFPTTLFTFNRLSGEDCFSTSLAINKPHMVRLVVIMVIDGSLESDNQAPGSILTTHLPKRAFDTLFRMIKEYPATYVGDILHRMTFSKVPFSEPRIISLSEPQEFGYHTFTDPYEDESLAPVVRGLERIQSLDFTKLRSKNEVYRTPAILPLPGLGSLKFLQALTKEDPEVFDNEALGLILRVLWDRHIWRFFLVEFFSFVCLYVCWTFFLIFSSSTTSSPTEDLDIPLKVLGSCVLFLNSIFTIKEFIQSNFGRNKSHFVSFWNLVDFAGATVVFLAVILTFALGGRGRGSPSLGVLTTLLLTTKLLAYLRGFNSTGWLVSVLMRNFYDVRGFAIIVFVILMGFTISFHIVFGNIEGECSLALNDQSAFYENCENNPYRNLYTSFLSTFEITILGAYNPEHFNESKHQNLAMIIFFLAIVVVLVVALNALIAVLGDSYSRVQECATANLRKERAELIIDYLLLFTKKKREEIEKSNLFFHALLESDADGDLLVNKDDWQGGLNVLRNDLNDALQIQAKKMEKMIDQMQHDVMEDVANLKSELTKSLYELSTDVAHVKRQNRTGLTLNGEPVSKAVRSLKSIGRNFGFPVLIQQRIQSSPESFQEENK